MKVDDVLRYGAILTDDQVYEQPNEENAKFLRFVRIRLISCKGNIYYLREKSGEVKEFKKVGVVG